MKITFLGAGSTIFARNVLGDVMLTPALCDADIALYDIDSKRLTESFQMLSAINANCNENRAHIRPYCGAQNRKAAIDGADFIVNAIQVGGYEPCTVTDFEIPKKYGLRQTIGDTLGIGGIMRTLRTLPIMEDFAHDIEDAAPNALFLNYSNPMAMLSGYMQRYTGVKTVGLCHSVQHCSEELLTELDMTDKLEGRTELIAGINHMAWLLELRDKDGNDLYPEIRKRAAQKNSTTPHKDMVRFEYIRRLGYYCTESSEHNAEYNPFFIKSKYPELIENLCIPLDEYPRRCIHQIQEWAETGSKLAADPHITHTRSQEYASYIMEAIATNTPYRIGGNVLNQGLITNLDPDACVEVPCMVDGSGVLPCHIGKLPVQLAAMNMTNINVQLMTIEAYRTGSRDAVYQAAMLDPHTAAELSIDDIVKLCDELIAAHGAYMHIS